MCVCQRVVKPKRKQIYTKTTDNIDTCMDTCTCRWHACHVSEHTHAETLALVYTMYAVATLMS